MPFGKHILYLLLFISITACTSGGKHKLFTNDKEVPDTLNVGMIESPVSFFQIDNEKMGLDYELLHSFADSNHLVLKIKLAKSEKELFKLLDEDQISLIASDIYQTKELKSRYQFVAYQSPSRMVLVQNIDVNTISDILDLRGKKISVAQNSIYHKRLVNLDEETGGDIVEDLVSDTITPEQMIEKVANQKIEYTFAHAKMASLMKLIHRKLDIQLSVGFRQKNGWVISADNTDLKKKFDKWSEGADYEEFLSDLEDKYYDNSPYLKDMHIKVPKGSISPYDEYFKKYAAEIGWDWKMLAAVCFHESHFINSQVSRAGAAGLMQLMPRTASSFGLRGSNVFNPESNIEAGVQYIKSLNLLFRKIKNKDERIKFILASYNSGPAHVLDAIALAGKYGKSQEVWFGQVEYYLIKKSEPEFYRDPVVKNGHFSSGETVRYVKNTLDTYRKFKDRR